MVLCSDNFLILVNLFELTDSIMSDCEGIGKKSLGNRVECREAASHLGLPSTVLEGSFAWAPKGCMLWRSLNLMYWNSHESEFHEFMNKDFSVICKNIGMCTLSYCTVVHQIKN